MVFHNETTESFPYSIQSAFSYSDENYIELDVH